MDFCLPTIFEGEKDVIMKNIIFVGFMGTGKTAVSKKVAEVFGKKYLSIDDEIEKSIGRSIKDIFSTDGEPYFRRLEKQMVEIASQKEDLIVDTGGGVVLDEENMNLLKKSGMVICLWSDVDAICERTYSCGHRPLLNVENPKKKIQELLEYRKPFYEKAEYHIDTSKISINEIVQKVKEIVNYGKTNN